MRNQAGKRLRLEKKTLARLTPNQLEKAAGLRADDDPGGIGSYGCSDSCYQCSYSGCPPCPIP